MYSNRYLSLLLYHLVDVHWRGEGAECLFLPQMGDDARSIIMGLLPFLRFLLGAEKLQYVDKLFTQSAILRANNLVWDAERGVWYQKTTNGWKHSTLEKTILNTTLNAIRNWPWRQKQKAQRQNRSAKTKHPLSSPKQTQLGLLVQWRKRSQPK
jgi:hypothetical protein